MEFRGGAADGSLWQREIYLFKDRRENIHGPVISDVFPFVSFKEQDLVSGIRKDTGGLKTAIPGS